MRGVYIAFAILLIVAVFGTLQLGLQRFEGFTTESSPDCCGITSDTPPITAAKQAIAKIPAKHTAAKQAIAKIPAKHSAGVPGENGGGIYHPPTGVPGEDGGGIYHPPTGVPGEDGGGIYHPPTGVPGEDGGGIYHPPTGVPGEDGGGVFHPSAESECPSGVPSTNINIYLGTRGLRSGTQPGSIGGLPKRRAPIPSALIPSSMLPSPAETSGSNGLQTYPTQLDQGVQAEKGTTATLHHDQIRVPTSELYFGAAGAGASSGSAMAGAAGPPGISQGMMAGQEAADWTGSLGDAPVGSNPLGSFAQKERITGMAQRLANTWLNAGAGVLGGLLPQSQPDGPTLATGTNPYMYASGTTNQYYPFGNQIGQSSNIYKNLGASQ